MSKLDSRSTHSLGNALQQQHWMVRLVQLRGELRELSLEAGLGARKTELGTRLGRAWSQACWELGGERDEGLVQRLAANLVSGVCSMARWLEPHRSSSIVPPLCMVLWCVSSSTRFAGGTGLSFDLVLPNDCRRAQALDWGADVRQLLLLSGIHHRVDLVDIPNSNSTLELKLPSEAPRPLTVWGCMALFEQYRRFHGSWLAQRKAMEDVAAQGGQVEFAAVA